MVARWHESGVQNGSSKHDRVDTKEKTFMRACVGNKANFNLRQPPKTGAPFHISRARFSVPMSRSPTVSLPP